MRVYDTEKVYDVLYIIKKRNYFVTSKSIFALQDFINGYMVFGKFGIYEEAHKLIYYEKDLDFNEFLYWIQDIPFLPVSNGPSFADFLFEKANRDEAKAFDLFYELLDEFKKLKKGNSDSSDMSKER